MEWIDFAFGFLIGGCIGCFVTAVCFLIVGGQIFLDGLRGGE